VVFVSLFGGGVGGGGGGGWEGGGGGRWGGGGGGGCSASVTLSGIWDITKRRGLGRRAAVTAVCSTRLGFKHQLSLHQRL